MQDYKPNSHRFREEQSKAQVKNQESRPEVQKVTTGSAKTMKKSGARKLVDIFMPERPGNIGEYLLTDLIIPSIKELIYSVGKNSLEMTLFNGNRRPSDSYRPTPSNYVSYRQYADRDRWRNDDRDNRYSSGPKAVYEFEEVWLESRGDAEAVLGRMCELVDHYGVASVGQLYDLAGLRCNYTAYNYGWTNIRNAEIVRSGGGYLIRMPKAMPID